MPRPDTPPLATRRRRALVQALAAGLAAEMASPLAAAAQAWPDSRDRPLPIRLLLAYPPGGVSDEMARLLADGLASRLHTPVRVEHRPGAGGVAAMEALARAVPDGHTLCYCAISPLVIAPWLGKPAYDAARDFQPVATVMHTPVLVLATRAAPFADLAGALALARREPGRLRWASSGLATVGHLVMEQVAAGAGVHITHVPYKGGGQQLTDALGGQFELLSSNVAAQQLRYLAEGRLSAIAVGAPARLPVLPAVPTLAELGHPDANLVSTFAIFAPAGLAPERLQRLNQAINQTLAEAALHERIVASNNLPGGGPADALARQIETERERHRVPLQRLRGTG